MRTLNTLDIVGLVLGALALVTVYASKPIAQFLLKSRPDANVEKASMAVKIIALAVAAFILVVIID